MRRLFPLPGLHAAARAVLAALQAALLAALVLPTPPAWGAPSAAQQPPGQAPGVASGDAPSAPSAEAGTDLAPPRPDLVAVPAPPIANLEPGDQEQLSDERAAVAELIADRSASDAKLAAAYGRLGSLYLLYDLSEAAEPALIDARTLQPDELAWPYYLGVLYQRDGRLTEAEASLARAHDLKPDDLPTMIRLGQVRLAAGDLDGAQTIFSTVYEREPRSAAALEGLGTIDVRQKRPQQAIERFQRALELQPGADILHHQLGLAYRDLGDLDKAKEHLALNKGGRVRFFDPLMDGLTGLLRGASIHLKRGNNALKDGLVDVAIREYRQAVAIDPKDPKNQYNLGFALVKAGQRDEAIGYFEKAIELDPGYRDAHYNLAAALAEEDRWDEAVGHYAKAVEIDPLDHAAHLEWAQALLRVGKSDRAAEELEALLGQLHGDEVKLAGQVHLELARLRQKAGDEEGALDHFRKAASSLPDSRAAHEELAKLLGRSGQFGEAAGQLDRVVELAPREVDPRFGRAMALILGGEYRRARENLEADLDVLPGNPVLSDLLARLLATAPDPAARDGARAVAMAEAAFRRQANLERAETVGMAYAEAGRFDDAVTWQRRVLGQVEPKGRPEVIARNRRYLALYEEGKPVRSPWSPPRGGDAK